MDDTDTPAPVREGLVPACPRSPYQHDSEPGPGQRHTVIGCGSTNVEWDGLEAFDCLDCGIFFTEGAADWVAS